MPSGGRHLSGDPGLAGQHPPLDTPSDGRGELRLVRLRLALALLAMGLLPVLVLVPAIRFLTDDTVHAQRDRLEAIAADIAAGASADLEGTRRAVRLLAADPSLASALKGSKAPKGAVADASAGLLELADGSPTVAAAAVLDRKGIPRLALAGEEIVVGAPEDPPKPDGLFATALKAPGGTVRADTAADVLTLATPLLAADESDPAPGVLRVGVSLPALLTVAAAGQAAPARAIQLVDLTDETAVATLAAGGDAMTLPDQVINLAADLGAGDIGTGEIVAMPLDVPGLEHLAIAVSEPLAVTSVPLPALLAIVLLIVLAGMLIVWMGRQILRPAEELAASRSQIAEMYDQARIAALHDGLTGLGNHRAFQEEMDRQLDQSQRYRVPVSLILLDIDEFKLINDAHGHAEGDRLLGEVGRVIRSVIRLTDRAFRVGGDEFAIILPHTESEGASILARRLLHLLLSERPSAEYVRPVSFSAGVVSAPQHGTNRLQLFAEADASLYWGKRHGRTLVTTYDPIRDRKAIDETMRAELSASVSKVISERVLRVVYQPIIHLPTGRVLGYEGLVRIPAESGFNGPASLFAAAEVTGHTFELDRACLETTIAGSARVPSPLLITLNISPRSFEAPEFSASSLLAILSRHGVDPSRVILELTEREQIENMARVLEALEQCRAAGIRIAADDVGAGNSGLRLLAQFKFDVVKIDLSLIQASAGREPVLTVLTSVIGLAQEWGALVVAEGVETPEQLRAIRRLGIDAAQGYLLGRPGEAPDLEWVDLDSLAQGGGWDSPLAAYERMVAAADASRAATVAGALHDLTSSPVPASGFVAGADGVVAVRHPGYPEPHRGDSWESTPARSA